MTSHSRSGDSLLSVRATRDERRADNGQFNCHVAVRYSFLRRRDVSYRKIPMREQELEPSLLLT
ncbi:MAG: hypothetical protein ABIS15_07270, partial [Gemmatimonadaceae bacterium]